VWHVGDRILDELLSGTEIDACIAAEIARGMLPPGRLANPVLERVRPTAAAIAAAAAKLRGVASPGSVDVRVILEGGRSISGTVAGVCGDVLCTTTYSKVNARHRIASWVRLLLLTAAHPERPFEAVTVGRARSEAKGATLTIARLPPLGSGHSAGLESALAHLATVLDIYDRGMREPLPLACLTSAAYAQATAAKQDPEEAARTAWESTRKFDNEDKAPEHVRAMGGVLSFAELMAFPPREDEQGTGWEVAEDSRFGRYARRLWSGPLAHEELSDS
jgi:exodeoxyribonuclease V gamma subunit